MKDEPWLKLLCDHLKYSLLTSPILLIDTLLHITMFLYEFRKYSNHTTFGQSVVFEDALTKSGLLNVFAG